MITHHSFRHPRAVDAAIKIARTLDRPDRVLWWALHTLATGVQDGRDELEPLRSSICNELCKRHSGLVMSMARKATNKKVFGSDIWLDHFVSAGNIALFQCVEQFNPWKKVRFSTYACRSIWRRIAKATHEEIKHKGVDPRYERDFYFTTESLDPAKNMMDEESIEHLNGVLRSLSDDDRQIVEWIMEGRSTTEIGRIIGRTHQAVTMRWNRIRRQMRCELLERGVE